jgi:hypothetical protein
MTAADQPPLTRFMLERATIVFTRYWHGSDVEMDEYMTEWHDFIGAYGVEVLALALAALGRLEPRYHNRPKTNQKHTLGPAQQKIVDALSEMGPKRATELAAITGIHERNLRRNLVSMGARGMLTLNGHEWGLPEWNEPTTETTNPAERSTTLPECQPVCESVIPAPEPPTLHLLPPSPAVEKGEVIAPPAPKTTESRDRVVSVTGTTNGRAKPEPASQDAEPLPILPNPSESDEQPLRLGDLPRLENEGDVEAWARRALDSGTLLDDD